MRILLLFNPISGTGKSQQIAHALMGILREAGHETHLAPTSAGSLDADARDQLNRCELVAVVGGDGAVRLAAEAMAGSPAALWQVPLGTENLFARQFGMSDSPPALIAAIQKNQTVRIDLGTANGVVFHAMTSLGFDAAVVHDLASRRRGRIRRLSYVPPLARQLVRWRPSRLTISVDGRPLVDGVSGMVVIANSPRYAFGMDPCPEASMTDGLLDVAFLPIPGAGAGVCGRIQLLSWMIRCKFGRHARDPRIVRGRGKEIIVHSDPPAMMQMDGDMPPPVDEARVRGAISCLEVRVRPATLTVLLPASLDRSESVGMAASNAAYEQDKECRTEPRNVIFVPSGTEI